MSIGRAVSALLAAAAPVALIACSHACAQGLRWRLVEPQAPPGAVSESGESCAGAGGSCGFPLDLGPVGDIEFRSPNRGVLITAGNGALVKPGVWEYDGSGWHELAEVCGASDGRIAWSGEEEFWTVSDGRPGRAANAEGLLPPLEDDTLCHFAPSTAGGELEVVRSYASEAFQESSYQPMYAAACLDASDCWFAGAPLPQSQPGAFTVRWNGASVEADPNTAAREVESMRAFDGQLLESVQLPLEEPLGKDEGVNEILHPFVLFAIGSVGSEAVFEGLRPTSAAPGELTLPEYASGSYPAALAGMLLSSDVDGEGGESLWAAAGPRATPPAGSLAGALTVLRAAAGQWSQVLGPAAPATVAEDPPGIEEDTVTALAGEPGTASAWIGLETQLEAEQASSTALATVAHVQANGSVSEEQLPSVSERAEGVAPQGATARLACPELNDCWLITTRGALFHLSEEGRQTLPADESPLARTPLITYRPPDQGLPQQPLAGVSAGEEGEAGGSGPRFSSLPAQAGKIVRVQASAFSHVRERVLRGDVLRVSFTLPVKARVRLLAELRRRVIASTRSSVLAAGRRSLRLALDPRRWPTKLQLDVRPLAPLPTEAAGRGPDTLTTSSLEPAAGPLAAPLTSGWLGR